MPAATDDWNRLLGACVEQAYNAVTITDARLEPPGPEILYVNPAFEGMTGYTREEVTGLNPRFLQGPETERWVLNRLRQNLTNGEPFEGHTINYRKDGTPFHMEWAIAPVHDAEGAAVTHFVAVQRDITRQITLEQELERRASTDLLTGLFHRVRFGEYLEAELNRLRRYGGEATLLLIDLDGFKAVNQEHGHRTGDRILQEVAQILAHHSREADFVGRWDGSQFILLAPETFSHSQGGELFAQKLRQAVANHPFDQVGSLTASIGCVAATPSDTPDTVLRRADQGLYAAKAAGGNEVVTA